MKKTACRILSTVLFFAIVGTLLMISGRISAPSLVTQKQMRLYKGAIENSIDIAFIGSSTSYRYYNIMDIWDEYGLTSCTYFGADLPFEFTIPMMEYVQTMQSPQLYVIDLRSVLENEFQIRYFGEYETLAYQNSFANALDLLNTPISRAPVVFENSYFEGAKYLQIFKILYNHEAFVEGLAMLDTTPLAFQGNQMMMFQSRNLSPFYEDFSQASESEYTLTEETKECLAEILAYCRQKNLNVYFTFTPYVDAVNVQDENIRREIGAYITENGFPFTDFRGKFEEIGLSPTTDFYDTRHVNILGAEKYTQFAMEYFLEAYEIVPNHEVDVIEEWDYQYSYWNYVYDRKIRELNEEIGLSVRLGQGV